MERAAGDDDPKILVEHEQRLANRIDDGLGKRAPIFDAGERGRVERNCLVRELQIPFG
jgi:hypothetical protein